MLGSYTRIEWITEGRGEISWPLGDFSSRYEKGGTTVFRPSTKISWKFQEVIFSKLCVWSLSTPRKNLEETKCCSSLINTQTGFRFCVAFIGLIPWSQNDSYPICTLTCFRDVHGSPGFRSVLSQSQFNKDHSLDFLFLVWIGGLYRRLHCTPELCCAASFCLQFVPQSLKGRCYLFLTDL